MKIQLVNYSMASEVLGIDYAWLSFKSYFEENNKSKTQWEWPDPITESFALHVDELVNQIVERKPDVVGFSLYVWNVGLSLHVAEQVKKQLPNCKIIVGGPHITYKEDINYFKDNYFIDAACKEDGYGEIFLTEYLYQLEQPTPNLTEVPYCVFPDKGLWKESFASFYKRNFKWPANIYQRNLEYLGRRIQKASDEDRKLYIAYETSRGCPFGCTYCEWGGGINSKVTFKPTEMIIEDIDFIMDYIQPFFFSFTDANFGIVDRDVDIIKHICEWKRKADVPSVMYFFGPSKVNKHNVYEIESLTAEHGMLSDYKVPVQDLNRDVLVNIDRTDEDWEIQLKSYIKIREKHGGKIRLEMILGLPGATLDSYYEALDYSCTLDTFGRRYVWHLLPTTPASKAEYREKFKIKSLRTSFGMRSTVDGGAVIIRKQFEEQPVGTRHLVVDPEWMEPTEIVIETSSYTREEWFNMFLLDHIILQTEVGQILQPITKYLASKGIKHSVFYRKFWEAFLYGNNKLTPMQNQLLQTMKTQGLDKLQQDEVVDFEYYDLPDNFPFQVRSLPGNLFNIIVYLNVGTFYTALQQWCNEQFGEDRIRDDLIVFVASSLKTIAYTPGEYKFITNYDWSKYMKDGEIVEKTTTYIPQDEAEWGNTADLNIRIRNHFLSLCSNSVKPKNFQDIKVIYE
jgi:putative methyltransferase